jgi:hypothetical protein
VTSARLVPRQGAAEQANSHAGASSTDRGSEKIAGGFPSNRKCPIVWAAAPMTYIPTSTAIPNRVPAT